VLQGIFIVLTAVPARPHIRRVDTLPRIAALVRSAGVFACNSVLKST
jgi:hypothetical protein